MAETRILIVDDDPQFAELLTMRLQFHGHQTLQARDLTTAGYLLETKPVDLVLCDLCLGRENGLDLLPVAQGLHPHLPVLYLTAHGTIGTAVEAMRLGAAGFVTKDFEDEELRTEIDHALKQAALRRRVDRLEELVGERFAFENIIGSSTPMRDVLQQVQRVARTNSTVLITGESGTGKELIVRALHTHSPRADRPFVAVNCAALPETLLENELFGHVKGAFTGAADSKIGLLSVANGGTVFLDEVGEIPLTTQVKLLRVLQEREFTPLGSTESLKVDIRIVSATNLDLKEEAKAGRFRSDLFYRLGVIPIHLPSLRDRREDIPPLVNHFVKAFNRMLGNNVTGVHPDAMRALMRYNWPGNVRELENVVERAMVMAEGDVVQMQDMLFDSQLSETPRGSSPAEILCYADAKATFEREFLDNLLTTTRGNVSEAARVSGRIRSDLYTMMKKHGINRARYV
jgi:two-component system response regulator GlrR